AGAPWDGRVRAPSTGRPRGRVASHDPGPLRPARGVLAAVAVARQRAAVSARAPRGGGTSLRVRRVHRGARPPAPHVPAADRARARDVRAGTVLPQAHGPHRRSEEHTSELQSPYDFVCRLLLEKKKYISISSSPKVSFRSKTQVSCKEAFNLLQTRLLPSPMNALANS